MNMFLHQRKIFSNNMVLSLSNLVHIHEQNGVAKRKYRHILNTTRALLVPVSFLVIFGQKALLTVVILINITPSFLLDDTSPDSYLFNSQFDYSSLHIFRCICFPFYLLMNVQTVPHTVKCIFLGYSPSQEGISVMILSLDVYVLLVMLPLL